MDSLQFTLHQLLHFRNKHKWAGWSKPCALEHIGATFKGGWRFLFASLWYKKRTFLANIGTFSSRILKCAPFTSELLNTLPAESWLKGDILWYVSMYKKVTFFEIFHLAQPLLQLLLITCCLIQIFQNPSSQLSFTKFQNERLHFYVDHHVYDLMRICNFSWPFFL